MGTILNTYNLALKIEAQKYYRKHGSLSDEYKKKLHFRNICTCNIDDKNWWKYA